VINFKYIERPDADGLKTSEEILKLIGAIDPIKGTITKIGNLLIKLPIEPFLSRAIIEGMMVENLILKDKNFISIFKNIPPK